MILTAAQVDNMWTEEVIKALKNEDNIDINGCLLTLEHLIDASAEMDLSGEDENSQIQNELMNVIASVRTRIKEIRKL